jgi:hypothetical protein
VSWLKATNTIVNFVNAMISSSSPDRSNLMNCIKSGTLSISWVYLRSTISTKISRNLLNPLVSPLGTHFSRILKNSLLNGVEEIISKMVSCFSLIYEICPRSPEPLNPIKTCMKRLFTTVCYDGKVLKKPI